MREPHYPKVTPLFTGMKMATEFPKLASIKQLIKADDAARGHFWMANRNMARAVLLKFEDSHLTVP